MWCRLEIKIKIAEGGRLREKPPLRGEDRLSLTLANTGGVAIAKVVVGGNIHYVYTTTYDVRVLVSTTFTRTLTENES